MAESNLDLTKKIANKAVGTPVQNWAADMRARLVARQDSFRKMLPRGLASERFVSVLVTYLIQNAETLSRCTPESLMHCCARIAQDGLDPSVPNEASIVPFKGKATVIRGYKGYAKMARRSDDIQEIDCCEFHELDSLIFEKGSNSTLKHTWAIGADRGAIRGFYAYAKIKSGGCVFEIMGVPEVLDHARRFTRASEKGPFARLHQEGINHENFVPYGLKTVLIRLCTRKLDMLPEVANALAEEHGDAPIASQIEVDVIDVPEGAEQ